MTTRQSPIGLAIVALLAIIAIGVWVGSVFDAPPTDPSPGWHTVVRCEDSPLEWCDDPNTLD
jgi:hypothetical protein